MMRKYLFGFLFTIFMSVNIVYADTISMTWFNADGTTYDTTTCNAGDDVILPTNPTKRGYTFTGWKTFKRIEYLKSTGTQYVDTNYIFSNVLNARIIVDAIVAVVGGLWNVTPLSGAAYGGPYVGVGTSKEFYYSAGSGDRSANAIAVSNTRYVFDLDIPNSTYTVSEFNNGIVASVYPITKADRAGVVSGILFGYTTNGGNPSKRSMTIYSVKMYDKGIIVRDFIPVLDEDDVPCMFDKVENKCYYNAGTGSFIVGPEVVE